MQDGKHSSGKGQHKHWNKDIAPILKGWEYEPGTINVRKIVGLDGSPKLQMRLDLGLMQMEIDGRPDGRRPHGCESLLDYYEKRLREYRQRHGTALGFHLTPNQCQSLREEAWMYYHRYVSLFVLGEFTGVARDTDRNLRVLDLCEKYAVDEQDRLILEQYRPYIIMMNTRAKASIEYEAANYRRALAILKKGLKGMKMFFEHFGQLSAYKHSNEVKILKQFGREIRSKLPVDPMRKLLTDLDRAVKDERYEEAARLRDEIEKLKAGGQQA
ncbi:MAG: UvrB/UvrC motif-containing protein [Bacillota bacterium]